MAKLPKSTKTKNTNKKNFKTVKKTGIKKTTITEKTVVNKKAITNKKVTAVKKTTMSKKAIQKKSSNGRVEVYADDEQGILPKKSPEQVKEAVESGELDEEIDTKEGQEKLLEDDEIEPWEAGFAAGASDEGQLAKDALTGEPLMGADNIIEAEYDGKMYRFVSERNAERFLKNKADSKKQLKIKKNK